MVQLYSLKHNGDNYYISLNWKIHFYLHLVINLITGLFFNFVLAMSLTNSIKI